MDQPIILMVFDIVLILSMLVLSWSSLAVRELIQAVILYIVFGLLIALAWLRLRAPDVALAEAAIGAGLTGALFFHAYQRITDETASGKNVK